MSNHPRPFGVPVLGDEPLARYGLVAGYLKPTDSGAVVWCVATPTGSEAGIAPDVPTAKSALYSAIVRASGRDTRCAAS